MKPLNLALQSNRQSKFLNKINETYNVKKVITDDIGEVYPNGMRTIDYVNLRSGCPSTPSDGSRLYFDINCQEGVINEMFLSMKLTTAGDNSADCERVACKLVKEVIIKQGQFEICRMNCMYILNRVDELPRDIQDNYNSLLSGDTVFNNTSTTFFLPLPFYFTDNERNNLLLNFHRDINVEVIWNNYSWTEAITAYEIKLGVVRTMYEKSYIYELIKDKRENKRNYLSYDVLPLKKRALTDDTETTFELKGNSVISGIHLTALYDSFDFASITGFTLKINNETILDINKQELVFLRRYEDKDIASNGFSEMSYHWGGRENFIGNLSLLNNNITLTVKYSELASDAYIYCNLEYRNVIEYDDEGFMSSKLTI